eukprot:4599643-Lingulodinium_polyedra.AAC.1
MHCNNPTAETQQPQQQHAATDSTSTTTEQQQQQHQLQLTEQPHPAQEWLKQEEQQREETKGWAEAHKAA